MKTIYIYLIFLFTFINLNLLKAQHWNNIGYLDTSITVNGRHMVEKITSHSGKITIGGYFKFENSITLRSLGQWNGTQWESMSFGLWFPGVTVDSIGVASSFADYEGEFYTSGGFNGAGGTHYNDSPHIAWGISKWNGADWFPLSSPGNSGFDSGVNNIYTYHNYLYCGGGFGTSWDATGSHSTQGISRWNDTVFSACGQMNGDFPPYFDFGVLSFCTFQDKLIAGGWFTSIDGSPLGSYSGIAAWNDTAWSALGNGFNNAVFALTVYNGELYAGGRFTASRDGLTPLNHIAKWNGINWQAVGEGLNDSVMSLTEDSVNNILYAGGSFTQTGLGIPAKHLAKWTGSNWLEVGGGTNRDILTMYSQNGNLYVGGAFTYVNDTMEAHLIACWGYGLNVGVGVSAGSTTEELGISPNPVNLSLTLSTREGMREVKIYDVLGNEVLRQAQDDKSVTIDVSGLAKGMYFVEVISTGSTTEGERTTQRKKFVKE